MVKEKHSSLPRRGPSVTPTFTAALEPGKAYTLDQFCERADIRPQTLAEWRRKRGFPIRDIGKGGMILADDVIEWLKSKPLKNGGKI